MASDRIRRVSEIYHQLLAREGGDRAVFLREACGSDEALRQEVESLLRYDGAAASFMEAPAVTGGAAHSLLASGQHLGPYTIVSLAGVGGMGEVYRARDNRLARDVAIKCLPAWALPDESRRARLEREARLLASLNHPAIAQVHALESIGGVPAIVMEWVPGTTLADRSPRALAVSEALAIARQIADALDAAHQVGVLHRDLTPANIRVLPGGGVKLLDFGLAKLATAEPVATSGSDRPDRTAAGVILGTPGYVSPEQARGLVVDKRTDIWAFGCVLYELLAGRRAYDGPTLSDTLARVLQGQPDWSALPPDLPSRVRELLQRCLAPDPARRLRDIGDARLDLDAVESQQHTDGAGSAGRHWAAPAAAAMLAVAALVVWRVLTSEAGPEQLAFSVPAPDGYAFPSTQGSLAVSPDQRHLAFVTTAGRTRQLWVRSFDSVTPRLIASAGDAAQPAWSPDGRAIAFLDRAGGNRVRRVDLASELVTTVTQRPALSLAWGRGGVLLLGGGDGRLYAVAEEGGDPVPVTDLDASRQELRHLRPAFLPDGRRFIYQALSQDSASHAVFLASVDSPSRTLLLAGLTTDADVADNYLIYQRNGALMAQSFDARSGRVTGNPLSTIESVSTYAPTRWAAAFSVSPAGTLIYRDATGGAPGPLAWFDREGRRLETVAGPGPYENPVVSPDGNWLAVCRIEGGQHDIWIVDLRRNVPTRLTTAAAVDDFPVWTPDSRHVIFVSNRTGREDLYRRAADGSGSDELLLSSPEIKRPTDVTADGTLLYTVRTGAGQDRLDIMALPLGGGRPRPVLASPINEFNGVLSPDGRWIAYQTSDSRGPYVYVQPFPPTGTPTQLSTTVSAQPRWSRDGRRLYVNTLEGLAEVDMAIPRRPGMPRPLFGIPWLASWAFDPSRERFLRPVVGETNDEESITVILNWTAGLRDHPR